MCHYQMTTKQAAALCCKGAFWGSQLCIQEMATGIVSSRGGYAVASSDGSLASERRLHCLHSPVLLLH